MDEWEGGGWVGVGGGKGGGRGLHGDLLWWEGEGEGEGEGENQVRNCALRELTMVHGCMLSSFGGKVDG